MRATDRKFHVKVDTFPDNYFGNYKTGSNEADPQLEKEAKWTGFEETSKKKK